MASITVATNPQGKVEAIFVEDNGVVEYVPKKEPKSRYRIKYVPHMQNDFIGQFCYAILDNVTGLYYAYCTKTSAEDIVELMNKEEEK